MGYKRAGTAHFFGIRITMNVERLDKEVDLYEVYEKI